MSWRIELPDEEPSGDRQRTAWRLLVGMQATVWIVIIASLLIIFVVGLFSSLFAQRSL